MLETEPKLIQQFVATGKVKIVYRHLLQLGERTERAAEASECASDQGKFWEMRQTLYQRQNDMYGASNVDGLLADMAQGLGMQRAPFASCLAANTHRAEVIADDAAGRAEGITARPVFVIGNTRLIGAQPIEAFAKVIGG